MSERFDDDAPAEGPNAPVSMTQGQVVDVVKFIEEDLDVDYSEDTDGSKVETNVESLTRGMKADVKNEYSSVTVLSSMKQNGLGKSVLGYWGGKKLVKNNFSFERNFFFKGDLEDIRQKTNDLPVGDYLFMDELIEMAYKREAMTGHVIDLNKWMAASQRKTGVILWGAIPDFYLLDSYLRGGKVDNYVECIARGVAVHFIADRFPNTDPWHSKELEDIQKKRHDGIHESVQKKASLLEKHPCFKQMIFWTRMPDYAKREYLECVRIANNTTPGDNRKRALSELSEELRVQYEKPMVRTSMAFTNLVKFLEIRGLQLNKILREAQIKPAEYKAMVEIAQMQKLKPILKIKKQPEVQQ